MAVADAVCRMVPGVLPDAECFEEESHWNGLLEYPQYSRPAVWHDRAGAGGAPLRRSRQGGRLAEEGELQAHHARAGRTSSPGLTSGSSPPRRSGKSSSRLERNSPRNPRRTPRRRPAAKAPSGTLPNTINSAGHRCVRRFRVLVPGAFLRIDGQHQHQRRGGRPAGCTTSMT